MDQYQDNWRVFYQKALARPHSPRTERALALNRSGRNVAVDGGCGTGSDIGYLLEQGYKVYGFDLNPESIRICSNRFADEPLCQLVQAGFHDFNYPQAGLLVANASLFFVDAPDFPAIWQQITSAIVPGGVFSGDFMGPKDSWVTQGTYPVFALPKHEVQALFADFDIVEFDERDQGGQTLAGDEKHWHVFSVLAVKR